MVYKRFPPGRGHVLLPVSSRAAGRAGLSLYAACKPRVYRMQKLTEAWIVVFGARWLPGPTTASAVELDDDVWRALSSELHAAVAPFDDVAVYSRVQQSRTGFAMLLLLRGRPVAFVKVRIDPPLHVEEEALQALQRVPPASFVAPELIGRGAVCGLSWIATTALPGRVHRPPRDPCIERISAEIQQAFLGWPRPADVPSHWEPMHGDLAPWNLRELTDGRLALIDWEDVAWGPPGADIAFYWGLAKGMGLSCSVSRPLLRREAAMHWHHTLSRRPVEGRDPGLWQDVHAAWLRVGTTQGSTV